MRRVDVQVIFPAQGVRARRNFLGEGRSATGVLLLLLPF